MILLVLQQYCYKKYVHSLVKKKKKSSEDIINCLELYFLEIIPTEILVNSFKISVVYKCIYYSCTNSHMWVFYSTYYFRSCLPQQLPFIHPSPLALSSGHSSVTQLCPTLRPNGLQHARPPCPSPTPGAYPNSRPSHR